MTEVNNGKVSTSAILISHRLSYASPDTSLGGWERTGIMQRRTFFRRLFGSLGAVVASQSVGAADRSVLIQESPIAGFQFHRGDAIWPSLIVGQELKLVRESSNTHDPDAVAIYFQEEQLGYVPRGDNRAIAQMLDRGENLEARISKLLVEGDPWERVRITISLENV